jgi:trypsin
VRVSVIITFSNNIQPIFLGDTFIGTRVPAKVSGWGATSVDKGPTSNILRVLETSTLSNDECQSFHSPGNAQRITNNHLCTNNLPGDGFCQTGAGGPLVAGNSLVGVASWNVPCALGFPVGQNFCFFFNEFLNFFFAGCLRSHINAKRMDHFNYKLK